jgi:formiminotetrahydrofolate cyclodeaminase
VTAVPDLPVRDFLDQLAARVAAPGGGGAAAIAAAMAAGLAAMAARFSEAQLPGASDLADQADELRRRVAGLADADARAYRAVLDAYSLPRDSDQRQHRVRQALRGAAAVPLDIAEAAAEAAVLAALVADAGNPRLAGDAATAALLAQASARSAACLVDINVGLGGLEPGLSERAAQAAAQAGDAAERVLSRLRTAAGPGPR